MPSNVESSVRPTDIYYVQEELNSNANPITPTDPSFKLISTVVESEEFEASAEFDPRTGLGNYVPVEKNRMQESHGLTVTYDLQRFPVDSSGNPQDPFADVALRDADNRQEATHTILEVEDKSTVIAESTWHYRYFNELENTHPSGTDPGATSKGTRIETYARGGMAEEASMELAPSDASVIQCEISYVPHKIRMFQTDQPASAETIGIKSTNSSDDTGATVDIETVDGATNESLTLDSSDATTIVTSTETYGSLRVSTNGLVGDLEVYTYDTTAAEAKQLLTVIRGSDARDGIEADTGVPLVGGGSFGTGSSLNDGVPALGSNLNWNSHAAGEQVNSTTISIENEISTEATDTGLVPSIHAGGQTINLESTVFGETESPEKFDDFLEGREGALSFSIEGGSTDIPRGYISEGGTKEKESGSAVMNVEVVWNVLEPTDGSDPLQFNAA